MRTVLGEFGREEEERKRGGGGAGPAGVEENGSTCVVEAC